MSVAAAAAASTAAAVRRRGESGSAKKGNALFLAHNRMRVWRWVGR